MAIFRTVPPSAAGEMAVLANFAYDEGIVDTALNSLNNLELARDMSDSRLPPRVKPLHLYPHMGILAPVQAARGCVLWAYTFSWVFSDVARF